MLEFFRNIFVSDFMPHGHCLLWNEGLVWLHVFSDSVITVAYYSIPLTLLYFVRKRQDLVFHWIFLLFAAFIFACGTTHLMALWTLWDPVYRFEGFIKLITAGVSMATALLLIPLVPKALALPSPAQLESSNWVLRKEILEREKAEEGLRKARDELEMRVQERTVEISRANELLKKEITRRTQIEEALKESLDQLAKKNRYENIVSTITRSVHQTINLEDVLENAAEEIIKNIDGVHNIGIFLVEGEKAILKSYRGLPDWFVERVKRIPYPRGFIWKTIMEGKSIYCADAENDKIIGPAGMELGTKSYLSMPLRYGGKTVGAIGINSLEKKNAFDEGELKLLEIIAQQIETAINNAQITEALRRSEEAIRENLNQLSKKNRYEIIISTVTRDVHQSIDLQEVLENAVDAMSDNIDKADIVGIYLVEDKTAELKAHRGLNQVYIERASKIPYSKGLTWKVITEGKPIYCGDMDNDTVMGPAGRQLGIKSYLSVPIRSEGKTVGMMGINSFEKNAFEKDEIKLLEIVVAQIEVAINNAKQVKALRESEERFRNMADTAPVMIWMAGPDMLHHYLNKGWLAFTGRTMEQELLDRWLNGVHPDDLERLQGKRAQGFGAREEFKIEYRLKRFDGEYRWIVDNGTPLFLSDGTFTGYIGSCIDITERKKAEETLQKAHDQLEIRVRERTAELQNANEILRTEIIERKRAEDQVRASLREKEVLLKEIHHRVKNNLQVISSLLNLQSRHSKNTEVINILRESQDRIDSMALVHEKLYQSREIAKIDFADYLRNLTDSLLISYGVDSNDIVLNLNIDNVAMGVDTAIPCGLIVSELVSNSLKHAFPSGGKGQIRVELYSHDVGTFTLIVGDNGVGLPQDLDFKNTDSLGLQLVCTLTDQLDGTIELVQNKEPGTEFKILFSELKYKTRGYLS